jgi:hypothetical protein
MNTERKLTDAEYSDILKWGADAVGATEIRSRLGGKVTKQRIDQILKKHGLDPVKERISRRKQAHYENLVLKWGKDFTDPDKRKDTIYQTQREKFRIKKANNRSYEWTVDFGELHFPTHCPVLGIELDYFADSRQENSVSFDRIDNDKGYVKGNVLICSWRANRLKNNGTPEEHLKIYEFFTKHLR